MTNKNFNKNLFLLICIIFIVKLGFAQKQESSVTQILKLADSLKYNAPEDALKHAQKALSIAKNELNQKNISKANSLLGTILCIQGNFTESLNYHLQALKINDFLHDSITMAINYNNIGMVLDNSGKDSAALNYYLKAIQIEERKSSKKDLIKPYNNIGILYANLSKPDSAICYFEKSAKLAHETGQPAIEGSIKHNIAMFYIGQAKYFKALELLNQSLEVHLKTNNDRGIATNYLYFGETYFYINNNEKGLSYLKEALILAKEKGFKDILSECYLQLSMFYEEKKDFSQALINLKLWAGVEENIINEASVSSMAEMQTKYETEKKQKENEILIKENKIKSLEINQQNSQRVIIIIFFSFLFLVGFFIFNRIRLKQKNKILKEKEERALAIFHAQEKEKVYLSKELHDGLGPLLSLIKLNVSSLDINDDNKKMILEIKELASEGMKEVRNISHALMPSLLDKKGLNPALMKFTEQINQSQNLKAELVFSVSSKLTQDTELNIYRIIQEALNNIIKHSDARIASIKIIENENQLELTIFDNGKGFDIENNSAGNGLNNIYSRVDFLKGEIKIKSEIGKGTNFIIKIPKKT